MMSSFLDVSFSPISLVIVVIGNIVVWSGVFFQMKLRNTLEEHNIEPIGFFSINSAQSDLAMGEELLASFSEDMEIMALESNINKLRFFRRLFIVIFAILFIGSWLYFISLQGIF